jgi:hypothetical protein
MAGNFHSFPCKEERMEYIVTAVLAGIFTLLFVAFYKFVINPQYVPSAPAMAKCPDMWNYNTTNKMCEPAYDTHCLPFNPDTNTLTTMTSKCNLARSCGTTWSGMCG